MKKNAGIRPMTCSSEAALAPGSTGRLKIDSGTSGSRVRDSITMKAAISARLTAPRPRVSGEVQPTFWALTSTNTIPARPPVTVKAPARSNPVRLPVGAPSGSTRGASSAAATPIGTLAQEQEAAEHQGVGIGDPGQVVLGEAQPLDQGRQSDADDTGVQDQHELSHREQAQRRAAVDGPALRRGRRCARSSS